MYFDNTQLLILWTHGTGRECMTKSSWPQTILYYFRVITIEALYKLTLVFGKL